MDRTKTPDHQTRRRLLVMVDLATQETSWAKRRADDRRRLTPERCRTGQDRRRRSSCRNCVTNAPAEVTTSPPCGLARRHTCPTSGFGPRRVKNASFRPMWQARRRCPCRTMRPRAQNGREPYRRPPDAWQRWTWACRCRVEQTPAPVERPVRHADLGWIVSSAIERASAGIQHVTAASSTSRVEGSPTATSSPRTSAMVASDALSTPSM